MALIADHEEFPWQNWLPKELRPEPGERDWNKFTRMCRRAKGHAKHFPTLVSLVAHDTGNLWLDASFDTLWEDYCWGEKEMAWLTKEWRQAQQVFTQIDPLLDRIDQHPRCWLTRLVTLWNRANKVTPRFKSDQRSATIL